MASATRLNFPLGSDLTMTWKPLSFSVTTPPSEQTSILGGERITLKKRSIYELDPHHLSQIFIGDKSVNDILMNYSKTYPHNALTFTFSFNPEMMKSLFPDKSLS
jgi:hypothetical protein